LNKTSSNSTPAESTDADEEIGDGPPLDPARVASIAGGDLVFAAELLQTFADSVQHAVVELTPAVAAEDRPALAREAHKLKGAAGNVGAGRLKHLAESLQTAATDADFGELARVVENVQHELQTVRAVVPSASSGKA
jgi:HPt (histidine-containing phosphotransfer) domain-containing protein